MNIDAKLISKVLTERLKNVLPTLISSNQTAYVKNRFIGEGGRLISDILEIADTLQKSGYLLSIDIEKAFDTVNHSFIIMSISKYGFGDQFKKWIRTILKNQESCVINGGRTSTYFKFQKGVRQRGPISAYLSILVLEIFFLMAKSNPNVKGLKLFENTILYTAYADDTTFF